MASEFAETLKALRENAGLSLYALAKQITWSKAAIGHAENDVRPPSSALAQALDRALGANGLLIALAASARPPRSTVSDVRRREMLRTVALSSASLAMPTSPGTEPLRSKVGAADIDRILGRTAQLRQLDDSLGGADTFRLYLAEVEATEALLHEASFSEETGRALLSVLAEQTQLAGWAAFDAGQVDRSEQLYQQSWRAAQEAADQALAANALALRAYQRAFAGAVDIELAQASCYALTNAVPARVRALVYDRAAWSFSLAGQLSGATKALDRAADAVGGSEDLPSPDWASWVDDTEISIMTGRCWASLRRPLRAVPALTGALAGFPDELGRDKALYLLSLAEAYVHAHEIELAATAIVRAHKLTVGIASARPKMRMKKTVALLARRSAETAMQLREQTTGPS